MTVYGTNSAYGTILGGDDIRLAAEATVRLWWPAYAAEVARQKHLAAPLLPFKAFNPALAMNTAIEANVPACLIVAPGLSRTPVKHGTKYEATWILGVGAVVAGPSFEDALRLAELYMQGLRSLILQNPTLGGIGSGITWIGENYDELHQVEGNSTVLGPLATFDLIVEGVIDISQGPTTPPDDPTVPAEWPLVETINVHEQLRGP